MMNSNTRAWLVAGVSGAALFAAMPVMAQAPANPPTSSAPAGTAQPASSDTTISEVIVTAQRRSENLQRVPIAVSAFTQASLQAQKIDGGPNLQQAVPNVTFNKSYYSGYNFQIRGIGTKQSAVTGDASTGIHLNNVPLTENRLFEAEFFDVERVEVLRGPQGTLYGRNATGGVVNVLTAKPNFNNFGGYVKGELGTYDTHKAQGAVNIPLVQDKLAFRLAGAYSDRSGFADNAITGKDVDGRNLYSVRATLGFNPTSTIKTSLMWQHFEEDDDRLSTGKALCVRDNGPSSVGGATVTNAIVRGFLSQGCANASINTNAAFGLPNSLATLYGLSALRAGLATGDLYAGKTQIQDLSTIESLKDPSYKSREDVVELAGTWDVTHNLQINAIGSYYDGSYDAARDDVRATPSVGFSSTALYPGGVVNDAQFGPTNLVQTYDVNRHPSKQWTGELRLSSSFSGPINFSVGGIYIDYKTTQDFYILSNAFQAFANTLNGGRTCALGATNCIYITPSSGADPYDHGDYLSHQPYHLESKAAFGELYWQITDDLKFTGGVRYTNDKKTLLSYPVKLFTAGSGLTQGVPSSYTAEFSEPTGRAGFDWRPHLSFTNSTLLYAFYSRGYKGGGPNNIGAGGIGAPNPIYNPEFVNAYEIGTKNTLLDGKVQLNLTGFYYDYKGYQISKLVNRIQVVENIDATVKGLEVEGIWQPTPELRFNLSGGLLDTNIENGSSIDSLNRNQGNANYTLVKTSASSACLVPTAALGNLINIIQQAPGAPVVAGASGVPTSILNACAGTYAGLGVVPIDGIAADLKGRQLPNAPKWTLTLGGQYTKSLNDNWDVVFRADLYAQGASYARVYNDAADRIEPWKNINLSVQLNSPRRGFQIEAYVKNLLGDRAITDSYLVDDALGLLQNALLQDPRIVGVSFSKKF